MLGTRVRHERSDEQQQHWEHHHHADRRAARQYWRHPDRGAVQAGLSTPEPGHFWASKSKYFLIFCYKQTKIKEEVEPALADFSGNSYQDFNFGLQQGQQDNVWAGPVSDLHTNLQGGMEKEGETGKLIFSHNVLFRIC